MEAGAGGREQAGDAGVVLTFLSAACRQRAASLLASMTRDEKAAQMILAKDGIVTTSQITSYGIGAVLADGYYKPGHGATSDWAAHIAPLHAAARASRLGIPLLYGLDAVHGMSHATDAIIFPHNIGLGATRDPDLVERVARATAVEIAATGADWTFAPTIAAARDERWGRTYESFSEDPVLVGSLGASAVLGLQGHSLGAERTSILATAKHFAGDGATAYGTSSVGDLDRGDVTLNESDFRALAVAQYVPAIRAGVGSIMVSYSSYRGTAMSVNRPWLTNVLKKELGFEGFLVSDLNAVELLPGTSDTNIEAAINAGLDMLMESDSGLDALSLISDAVAGGRISSARVDDAVTRILRVKCGLGLFEGTERSLDPTVASPAHRLLAKEAVEKSLVVLKNDLGVLPLNAAGGKILLAGSGADSQRRQMGGWTINWDGSDADDATGTTLLSALTSRLGQSVVNAEDPTDPTGADAVILVMSERPYAEYLGDASDLTLSAVAPDDVTALSYYSQYDVPIIAILFSGRPLVITEELPKVSAFIAAFLPGTAADAIVDVLYGVTHPTGKLPMTWPKSMTQLPINLGDPDYVTDPPLFPLGFGLTY